MYSQLRKIFGLLLLCLPFSVLAQKKHGQQLVDSLIKALPQQKNDSTKADVLYATACAYLTMDPGEAAKYAATTLDLSKKIGYKKGVANATSITSGIYQVRGKIDEASASAHAALALYTEIGDKSGIADCYMTIGNLTFQKDNYPEALKWFFTALKTYEEINDKKGVASCYGNIGNIYNSQEHYDDALKYFKECLKISEELHNIRSAAHAYQNIGNIYLYKDSIKLALNYSRQALKIWEDVGNKQGVGLSYADMGHMYNAGKNYPEALKYFSLALKTMEEFGDSSAMADAYGGIGDALLQQNKYADAEKYLNKELKIGREQQSLIHIEWASRSLSEIYKYQGKYLQSLEAYKDFVAAKDSMFNEAKVQKTVQAQMQYDFDKKESLEKVEQARKDTAQQLKLQKKNVVIFGSIAAFASLLIISMLLIRQGRIKANQERAELEQKQLRAQMNPHFIFNCLNSIQHFVVAGDVKNANKYLSGFAILMRQTLENSKEGTITLRSEIAYLENYLALELMRFEDRFSYTLSCAPEINIDSVEIPSMIIQPFIENAIRHGLCYLVQKKGILSIRFYMHITHLCCEIDDNGIGREESQKLKMASEMVYESQGMELTRQRLALVSKSSGSDYQIEIIDKKDNSGLSAGTTVLIKFPANT